MEYSFKKGLGKALVSFVLFAIPVFINLFPEYANLTIGAFLVMLVNFLKVKFG